MSGLSMEAARGLLLKTFGYKEYVFPVRNILRAQSTLVSGNPKKLSSLDFLPSPNRHLSSFQREVVNLYAIRYPARSYQGSL
jgi:hypothetical protein